MATSAYVATESTIPPKALAAYEKLVETVPDLERRGAKVPYTSKNGHMFSFLTPDGTLALRLDAERREKFLAKHKTKLVEQHGRVMKEYVAVPAALLSKTRSLKADFSASYAYVSSLKPKPTTRKKKAASKKKTTAKKKTKR